MNDTLSDGRRFPRIPLFGAMALIVGVTLAAATVRITGMSAAAAPAEYTISERDLTFADMPNGSIDVIDAHTAGLVYNVAPGTNGFLRGTLRGLAQERKREHIGPEVPFRLMEQNDGRLILEDSTTQRRIDLSAFGPVNVGVFARLMPPETHPLALTEPVH